MLLHSFPIKSWQTTGHSDKYFVSALNTLCVIENITSFICNIHCFHFSPYLSSCISTLHSFLPITMNTIYKHMHVKTHTCTFHLKNIIIRFIIFCKTSTVKLWRKLNISVSTDIFINNILPPRNKTYKANNTQYWA